MAVNPEKMAQPWDSSVSRDFEAEALLANLYVDRVDELADVIITHLSQAFPQSTELGDDFARDVLAKTSVVLKRAIQLLGSGESFEKLGPIIEDSARLRRRQSINQEMMFFFYRYVQHLLFEEVSNGIKDHPQAQRLTDAMALRQLEFQWVVSRRVAAAYDTGDEALAASREASTQRVLEQLLGQQPSTASIDEHAITLGLLMPINHVAVTVASTRTGQPATSDEPNVRSVARVNPWSVVGGYRSRVVVIGRGAPWGLTQAWGGCSITPEILARPELLAERVALAGAAADVAQRLGMEHADADEVAPFIAVAAIPPDRQEAFLELLFGDLHTSARGLPILQAVAVSVSSAGRREAAQRLQVHPNTLDYRLSRFRELTGINLTNPVQRLRCDLGLFLLGHLSTGDAFDLPSVDRRSG